MRVKRVILAGGLMMGAVAVVAGLSACGGSGESVDTSKSHVVGKSKVEIGRYIVMMGGCNDCHTPGMMQGKELKDIPEDVWLTGTGLGFNGPWGTSYPANLRQKAVPYKDDARFIAEMRKRNERPPMPWASLHAMTDEDLGAVLAYIKSLPLKGEAAPEPLPPGKEPPQPFIVMVPGVSPALGGGGPATQK